VISKGHWQPDGCQRTLSLWDGCADEQSSSVARDWAARLCRAAAHDMTDLADAASPAWLCRAAAHDMTHLGNATRAA